jgi:hypothetical protein
MKTEGSRGRDGFIHDDDCLAGNGSGTVSGTGPCTCSILIKPEVKKCNLCRKIHETGDCPWKHSAER